MNKITIIGAGKMASSMMGALSANYTITLLGRDKKKLSELLEKFPKIYTMLIDDYDISEKNVLLCVKPNSLKDVASKLIGTADNLFSVLAGTTIQELSIIKSKKYYRVMPNIGAKYSKSITSIYHNEIQEVQEITNIFRHIGTVVWAKSEMEINLVTALCSSGIAFLALVAESLSDAIVREGMSRDKSVEYVRGLFESFSALLSDDSTNYSGIKNNVMSPAGTTADGYYMLEKYRVRSAFMSAINASCAKAKSLK